MPLFLSFFDKLANVFFQLIRLFMRLKHFDNLCLYIYMCIYNLPGNFFTPHQQELSYLFIPIFIANINVVERLSYFLLQFDSSVFQKLLPLFSIINVFALLSPGAYLTYYLFIRLAVGNLTRSIGLSLVSN